MDPSFRALQRDHSEGYKSLQEGDVVEFEITQGQKGPQASMYEGS